MITLFNKALQNCTVSMFRVGGLRRTKWTQICCFLSLHNVRLSGLKTDLSSAAKTEPDFCSVKNYFCIKSALSISMMALPQP